MSIWQFVKRVTQSAASGVGGMVEAVRTLFGGDPQLRRRVAFSVAMIALSAKMAKADGVVSQDEIRAFQQIFEIPAPERRNVARLYDLAKQDVAGFEAYARRMASLCGSGHANCAMLEDILDGLFHIAKADGRVSPAESEFLRSVAATFGFSDAEFQRIRAGHLGPDMADPYAVLGVTRAASDKEIKAAWRKLIRETHPDRLIAEGLPKEFIDLATEKVAIVNAAYDQVAKERGLA